MRVNTGPPPLLIAVLAAGVLAGVASPARGQGIEPRAYSNAPVGGNFLIADYAYTRGGLSFDPAMAITNANLDTSTAVVAYARMLDLQVSPSWSQYDPSRLVNFRTNRWSFKPEIGTSKAAEPWTLELHAAAAFLADADDFYGRDTRSQDPLYSLQGRLIYAFRSGIWVSVDATYVAGSCTAIDGVLDTDLQQDGRVGATLALPVDRADSASDRRGVRHRVGPSSLTRTGGKP